MRGQHGCQRQTTGPNFHIKKMQNSHFYWLSWIQYGKHLQVSTNKPSSGSVVLEIAAAFLRIACKFLTFVLQNGS